MSLLKSTVLLAITASGVAAQSAADGPVLGSRKVSPTVAIKIWNPAGRVRLVGWDRDSVLVRGRIAKTEQFFFGGGAAGMKLGVETGMKMGVEGEGANVGRSDFVVYLPRQGKVSVKTVSADIEGTGVSGSFYTVSGSIRLSGGASSVEVESMNGNLDLNVDVPWMRARTGDGHLLLRGRPKDVDAATIGGTLDIATPTVMRGQFGSVSGDIHYIGSPPADGIFEFSNHSGSVDLTLPPNAAGTFSLSSIIGSIENGFARVRPISSSPHALRLVLGRGGASVTVRTYKGLIRLRPE